MGSLFFLVGFLGFYGLIHTPAEKLFYLFFVGPESQEVVLVSAAHCNFVCKVLSSGKSFEQISLAGLGHFKHA